MTIENIVGNGIYNSQVASLIGELSKRDDLEISVAHFYPLLGVLRTKAKKRVSYPYIQEYNLPHNTKLFLFPILIPTKFFYLSAIILPFFIFVSSVRLGKFLYFKNYDIIHCRSYPAALLAVITKKFFKLSFKVHFDTRGYYPEEGILSKSFFLKKVDFKLWKRIESFLFKTCDSISFVSFRALNKALNSKGREVFHLIPPLVDLNKFKFSKKERKHIRRKFKIEDDEIVIAFCGSFSVWYDIEDIFRLYDLFKKEKRVRILIISNAVEKKLYNLIKKYSVSEDDILKFSLPHNKVANYLSIADIAVIPHRNPDTSIRKTIIEDAVSIKLGEYAAIGIPSLVPNHSKECRGIIERYNSGIVYKKNKDGSLYMNNFFSNISNFKKGCKKATEYFCLERNSLEYVRIYKKLVKV
ncbi:MAG: glycosyltransferase [Thermodesulfobacteriota bacterium]|nr:glycosyltransferase [Thermodesulfobacteriota bacterium]